MNNHQKKTRSLMKNSLPYTNNLSIQFPVYEMLQLEWKIPFFQMKSGKSKLRFYGFLNCVITYLPLSALIMRYYRKLYRSYREPLWSRHVVLKNRLFLHFFLFFKNRLSDFTINRLFLLTAFIETKPKKMKPYR